MTGAPRPGAGPADSAFLDPPAGRSTRLRLILATARTLRGFGAGALSVVLGVDLAAAGYSPLAVGLLLGLAMGAAAAWAIVVPGRRLGLSRRNLFVVGAFAIALGGFLLWIDLASTWVLIPAMLLGGIVAGGSDISPLGALEQGALSAAVADRPRTRAFSEYNFVGYLGTAVGALAAGPLSAWTVSVPGVPATPRDSAFLLYGLLGVALIPTYLALSANWSGADAPEGPRRLSGTHRGPILRLSGLFTVDAFAGGMIANALVAYFFVLRFGTTLNEIGVILSVANIAAGGSLLLAAPLAQRIGLIPTMVFTHLPSSVLLLCFAVAPTVLIAAALWIARSTISQMDVPTRQSYTQALVPRDEGAAAAGYTTAARSAQAFGSPVSGALFALGGPWLSSPFALAGAVKIAYDLALFRGFRRIRPPEEQGLTDGPPLPPHA